MAEDWVMEEEVLEQVDAATEDMLNEMVALGMLSMKVIDGEPHYLITEEAFDRLNLGEHVGGGGGSQ